MGFVKSSQVLLAPWTENCEPMSIYMENPWGNPGIISIHGECLISILVGGLEHFFISTIYGIILPTDFHIFQDGCYTTNQLVLCS